MSNRHCPLLLVLLAALTVPTLGCREKDAWEGAPTTKPLTSSDGEVSIIFAGDMLFSRNVEKAVRQHAGGDFNFLFEKVKADIQEADVGFGNLETPISTGGARIKKRYVFRSSPEAVQSMVAAGFDVLSLANNHTLDFGEEAALDTEKHLAAAKLRYGGLVRDQQPQEPVIMDVRGTKIGFLFYCDPKQKYSCAEEYDDFPFRPAESTREALKRDIKALRPNVDVLVVSLHWGIEHRPEPHKHMEKLGRFIIDQGADVIAGHHPHIQQRVERYKKGVILYSMGNFIFDQWSRPHSRVARLYRLVVGKDGVKQVLFKPLEIALKRWQPTPLTRGWVDVDADSEVLRLQLPTKAGEKGETP